MPLWAGKGLGATAEPLTLHRIATWLSMSCQKWPFGIYTNLPTPGIVEEVRNVERETTMPAEEREPYHKNATEEHSLVDELAVGVADDTITRSRALKLVGAVLLGGLLSSAFPGLAEARKRHHRRRRRRGGSLPTLPLPGGGGLPLPGGGGLPLPGGGCTTTGCPPGQTCAPVLNLCLPLPL